MDRLIAAVVGAVFLAVFVGFLVFAIWDLRRQGLKVVPKLLLYFAGFAVVGLLVDLTVITALGTRATTTFQKVSPPKIAPVPDKAQEAAPGDP